MYEHIQDEINNLYSREFIQILYALQKSCNLMLSNFNINGNIYDMYKSKDTC
jgi:hypothetical protein